MLTVHLWKECREQRLLLGAFVLVLAVIALGLGLLAPPKLVPADAELWFVIVALGAGFVALAGDLVPGEERRGQIAFLLRTPGALRRAFVSKIVVLLVGLTLLLAIGWTLGELCLWLAGGRGLPGRQETLGHAKLAIAWIAAAITIAAPWAFAVSCWMSRGASVLPATALTLALVFAPPILVGTSYSAPVALSEIAAAAVLLFAGGVLAAWLSFVRGLRFGRGAATLLHGLSAAAVFVLPSWAWCATTVWAWHHVDPTDRGVTISDALLGADASTAFVTLDRNWTGNGPVYSVAVDLRTGNWRQLGAAQAHYAGVGVLDRCEWLTGLCAPQPFVVRWQLNQAGQEILAAELCDGRTGAVLAPCPGFRTPDAFRRQIADAARRTTPFRLPNGGRAWFEGRTIVVESSDGAREVIPWPDSRRPGFALGFGFYWLRDEGGPPQEVFDLSRRRTVPSPTEGLMLGTFVRPGCWALQDRELPEAFDPDTGTRVTLDLPEGSKVGAIASDGRLFVTTGAGDVFLVDPDSNDREQIVLEHDRMLESIGPADWRTQSTPPRTPSGAEVVRLRFRGAEHDRSTTFARRDGTRLASCFVTKASVRLVAIPDDDHVLVITGDDRRLERWRFGSDEVEVLFRVGGEDLHEGAVR